jgi:hypothetical protein
MITLCRFCKNEIIGRDSRAKVCFPCLIDSPKRTGASAAINAVQKAIKKGLLAPVKTLLCVDCNRNAECYDHRDYNKPLDVVPVCRKCNYRRGSAIPLKKTEELV